MPILARPAAKACAALFVLSLSLTALAQDKILLRYKADAGQATQYASNSIIEFTDEGEDVKLETVEKSSVKAVKVEGSGITFEKTVTESKMIIEGEEIEDEELETLGFSYTLKPNGEVISYVDADKEATPEDTKLTVRLLQSSFIVFRDTPVGPGDSWTHVWKKNAELGLEAATAAFRFVGMEAADGVQAAKIAFTYAETEGSRPFRSSGHYWIDPATGDTIKFESDDLNVPIDLGLDEKATIKGTNRYERTGGGFLAGQAAPTAQPGAKPAEPEKGSIDAKIKGFEKMDGLFTLYRKTEEGRTKLFMEIKKSQLGQLAMLQTSTSSGNAARAVAGDPISDFVFEFREMPNNKVYLVAPNFRYFAKANTPTARALARSLSESYVEAYDVEARQKDRDSLLIDVTNLFLGNLGRVFDSVVGGGGIEALLGGGGAGVSPDREKSYIKTIKSLPENVFAEVVFAFTGRGGRPGEGDEKTPPGQADSRGLVVKVSYLLSLLPGSENYVPRRYDNRVGYFKTTLVNLNDPTVRQNVESFIWRWNLVKKDPKAALSEPVKPIVFWMDNAIPNQYRAAVRAGLLNWNISFEKIGIKNAIQVKQLPDDSDIDHADVRYNIIRWIVSPSEAYAVAHARIHPITGEILNASISIDAGIIWATTGELDTRVDPSFMLGRSARTAKSKPGHENCLHCRYGHEASQKAALGAYALQTTQSDPALRTIYLNEFITHVVLHEMGHILGLRHNFASSTLQTMEQLKKPGVLISSSVMDYVPFNPSAIKQKGVEFYQTKPGLYDEWALKYGYMDTGIKDSTQELPKLREFAKQGSQRGLVYQSDEVADSVDPYVTRFDLAADPLEYWTKIITMNRHLIFTLDQNLPKPGQSYFKFTSTFRSLLSEYMASGSQAARFIGGVQRSAAHRGDPGAKPTILPVAFDRQRAALKLISQYIFAENALEFPKRYYRYFTTDPDFGFLEGLMAGGSTFPMFDTLSGDQAAVLQSVLNDDVLNRVLNQEFEAEKTEKPLTVAEVYSTLRGSIWSEVGRSALVTPLRRQLQREHIDALITLGVGQTSGRTDVHVLAWEELRQILAQVQKAKSSDAATKAHYADVSFRIRRALNAVETLGGGASSGGGFDLGSLLSGRGKGKG